MSSNNKRSNNNKANDPSPNNGVPDMRSAMTISTINALAGENVHHHLDSSHRTIQRSLSHPSQMNDAQLPLTRTRSNSSNGTSSHNNSPNRQQQQQQQQPRRTSNNFSQDRELAESVGFMAQGLAWIREQSHRRRRQYLQNQAEQQARIIKQAQEEAVEARRQGEEELQRQQEQLAREQDLRVSLGLQGNSTFQNITKHNLQQQQNENNNNNPNHNTSTTTLAVESVLPSVAGICGMRSQSESDDDYEEEINFVTNNCIIAEDHFSAESRSGDGYTLQMDIGNDNTVPSKQKNTQQQQQQQEGTTTTTNGRQTQQQQQQQQTQPVDMVDDEEEESFVPKVRIQEESNLESHPYILNETEMQQIAIHVLPRTIAYAKWKRLYSLARDGDSFDACLRLVQNNKSTLMVVRTSKNSIFGGYADSPWEPPSSSHIGIRYYGNAGACLFSCPRYASAKTPSPPNNKNTSSSSNPPPPPSSPPKTPVAVVYYKWTGMNRYIQLCDVNRRMLAFGGGGENSEFGLCVEHDFQHGSTGACDTFGNLPLCHDSQFDIVDMEIYGFCIGQF